MCNELAVHCLQIMKKSTSRTTHAPPCTPAVSNQPVVARGIRRHGEEVLAGLALAPPDVCVCAPMATAFVLALSLRRNKLQIVVGAACTHVGS